MDRLGVILAGGRSARMGQNKALLQIEGRTVIGVIADALSPVCGQLIITSMHPEPYSFTGLPVIPDQYEGDGPLAGIHAALAYSEQEWNLVCSCDHPFASRQLFSSLLHTAEQSDEMVDAVIPFHEGRLQPLVAAYRRRTIAQLEYCLQHGQRRVVDWTGMLNVRQISLADLPGMTGSEAGMALFNMNRPADYAEAIRMAAGRKAEADLPRLGSS